jgi:hypothetical protein
MRLTRSIPITIASILLLGIPASATASSPIERIVERDHKTEIVQVVTDDICGEIYGPPGRGAGTLHIVETGHRTISIYEDRFHVVDVENGTYWYDYDDPAIPDVSGRYVSPFSLVVTKSENLIIMENLHEFLPGDPDGIRIWFRYHLTWKDDAPVVERDFFNVTGCP